MQFRKEAAFPPPLGGYLPFAALLSSAAHFLADLFPGEARKVRRAHTLGRFTGVRDGFHLNFICRWLCAVTRSQMELCPLQMQLILQEGNTLWG